MDGTPIGRLLPELYAGLGHDCPTGRGELRCGRLARLAGDPHFAAASGAGGEWPRVAPWHANDTKVMNLTFSPKTAHKGGARCSRAGENPS